ncbi:MULTISPECIES: nuclear transport factor 2 family protein [Pseudomonas syringae group]|uniref:nuclear transport factor 2 family protein n=1 Tax=Pseudomonas syringae group TaxID=136849 RepID=UPI000F042EB5|nr:nuclear transport factor 2 family protein [Pseudomonas viridiflava]MBD8807783.1 nuclear transport factor 2 family protein [Pseudomonas syringae]MCF9017439.1 nuclear transport factor 2 family protein [Pseudomonas syringae]
MKNTTGEAINIARYYVDAMMNKKIEIILSISSEDVVCISPLGETKGVESFRSFHDGFARMTTKLSILAIYGDDEQAVIVYDVETHPVPHSTVAEFITVKNGKLIRTQVIYDATPFASYLASMSPN